MNERIRELAEQCRSYWKSAGGITYPQFDHRKFAELIVRECVQTLIDKTPERYTNESAEEYWEEDWDKGYDRAMQDCVNHIQEHFGIEE